jgi:hypothetical protein
LHELIFELLKKLLRALYIFVFPRKHGRNIKENKRFALLACSLLYAQISDTVACPGNRVVGIYDCCTRTVFESTSWQFKAILKMELLGCTPWCPCGIYAEG